MGKTRGTQEEAGQGLSQWSRGGVSGEFPAGIPEGRALRRGGGGGGRGGIPKIPMEFPEGETLRRFHEPRADPDAAGDALQKRHREKLFQRWAVMGKPGKKPQENPGKKMGKSYGIRAPCSAPLELNPS